jgi:hypothetical protein
MAHHLPRTIHAEASGAGPTPHGVNQRSSGPLISNLRGQGLQEIIHQHNIFKQLGHGNYERGKQHHRHRGLKRGKRRRDE